MNQAGLLRCYSEYFEERGDYLRAERLLKKVVDAQQEAGCKTEEFATDLYNLGLLNLALDKYDIAHDFLLDSLAIRMTLRHQRHPEILEVLDALSMAAAEGDWYLTA